MIQTKKTNSKQLVSNLPALRVCVCSHRYTCTCQIYVVMHIFCMQITLVLQPQLLSTENCDLSSTGTGTKIPDSHFRGVTKEAFSLGKRKKLNQGKKVTPKHQHLNSCFQVKWYHVVIYCKWDQKFNCGQQLHTEIGQNNSTELLLLLAAV